MSYAAVVYKVMVASPSDVSQERLIARDSLHEWNDLHSEDRGIVLLPIGWETHANPSMAGPAQDVINSQVLEGCDLLIGIFWTRLGTPTANAASGSIEEIERHLGRGGNAMLYFSDTPVEPSSIDPAQYAALREFREQCRQRGLVDTYVAREEFREKLRRHLTQVAIRDLRGSVVEDSSGADVTGQIAVPPRGPPLPQLSREAQILLYNGSQDKHATIARHRYFGGMVIQANKKTWPADRGDARAALAWWSAVDELQALGLIQERGTKGEVFELTREGFATADVLGPQPDT